jgi:MFS family permease
MTEITRSARGGPAGNIGRFFLYTALKGLGFGLFTSTWVVYLQQHRHLSLGLYLIISFTTGVLQPIAMAQVQDHVTDTARATVLSVQSLLATVVAAFAQPLVGLASDRAGMPTAYFLLAGIAGFGAVLFAAHRRPVARAIVQATPVKEGELNPWISPRTA